MPKATKLHSKGKPKSIQKACNVHKDGDNADPEDSIRQFQLELCWCVQQLERTLQEKKGNEKQLQDAWKVLTVLKNNNQPIIRKRQLMRTHFGDYRAKMAAEEKKLAKMASKMKITETPTQPKATFLRKSAFLTTGDSSFKFNFDVPEENTSNTEGNTSTPPNSNINQLSNANVGSTELSVSNVGATESGSGDANISKVDSNVQNNVNNFKFKFTDSTFKFNFPLDA